MRFGFLDLAGLRGFGGSEIIRAFGWILGVIVILLLVIEPESWYRAETVTTPATTPTTETTTTKTPATTAAAPAPAKTATTTTTSTTSTQSKASSAGPARPPGKPLTLADLYPRPHMSVQRLPKVLSRQPRKKTSPIRRILDLLKKIA